MCVSCCLLLLYINCLMLFSYPFWLFCILAIFYMSDLPSAANYRCSKFCFVFLKFLSFRCGICSLFPGIWVGLESLWAIECETDILSLLGRTFKKTLQLFLSSLEPEGDMKSTNVPLGQILQKDSEPTWRGGQFKGQRVPQGSPSF